MKNRIAVLVAIGVLLGRVAFGATELVVNGGFESPTAPWQFLGNLNGVSFSANQPFAHGGTNFLSLGNVNGTNPQRVFQVVTVPADTILAKFSYFWDAVTLDPALTSQLSAIVLTTNGLNLITNLHSDLNVNVPNYQQKTFDLTAFAGQSIAIGFQVDFANTTNGAGTTFRVDDASLLSFTAADVPANDNFANAVLLTTNTSVFATNVVATAETGEPKHANKTGGHSVWWKWVAPNSGDVTLDTLGSTFDTLLAVYTGSSVSSLKQVAANDDNNANNGILTSKVKFLVSAGTEYEIAVDGKSGETGVAQLNLKFSVDSKDPKVTITSPKSKANLTNSTVLVQGTASDDLAVALVQVRLENAAGTNDYQSANGTNSWSLALNGLIPGPNTIRARAFDTSSNESSSVISTVNFVVVSPLTVTVGTGSGTITPNLNNTLQNVGATLTMTAKPAAGQVFSSWSGDINANTAALTFVMRSNLVLQANFAPNPFLPVTGTYQGLFYNTNGPTHESSGFLTATLSSAGAFSARITLAGKSYSLSGQFSAGGSFSNNIVRKGLTPVSAQLHLDLAGGGITGTLSDGTWTAQLVANKTLTSPGATAGKYTLVLPGGLDGLAQPGGDGNGTLTVSSAGAISLKGALADGSKVTQKANLLTTGQWPFYVSLYSGNGSIFGWLTFTNGGYIVGPVDWFKKAQPGAKLYPNGFTNVSDAAGSIYLFTNGVPVLNFATGQFTLSNGNLASNLIDEITLDSASKITSTNATLKISLSTSTGSFKGSVANPAGGKAISFTGVVLQKQNVAGGFFTGATQTGRVHFGPDPM